jgi:hypothetical protein
MKRARRTRTKAPVRPPKPIRDRRQTVRRLTAQGYSGDEVAALIGLNKNRLRSTHALDLRHGREIARAQAEAAEEEKLSAEEAVMRRALFAGFGTHWEDPDGRNVLHGYRTIEEQERLWREWLRRARTGKRVLPVILEAELFD